MLVMQALARVLLKMQARDADLPRRAVGKIDLARLCRRPAAGTGRLIAGRQIGIEIILAVEDRDEIDLRRDAEAGLHRLLDTMLVDHRQHAGECGIDQPTCVFGSAPNAVAAPEKSLAFDVTCAWVSMPITISQSPVAPLMRLIAQLPR